MSTFEEVIHARNLNIDDILIEVYVGEINSENIRKAISISSSLYPLQTYNVSIDYIFSDVSTKYLLFSILLYS